MGATGTPGIFFSLNAPPELILVGILVLVMFFWVVRTFAPESGPQAHDPDRSVRHQLLMVLFAFVGTLAYFGFDIIRMSNAIFNFIRKIPGFLILIAVVFSGLVAFFRYVVYPKMFSLIPFDSVVWKNGTIYTRSRMAKDLVKTYSNTSLTRREVLELLGNPTLTSESEFLFDLESDQRLKVTFPNGITDIKIKVSIEED